MSKDKNAKPANVAEEVFSSPYDSMEELLVAVQANKVAVADISKHVASINAKSTKDTIRVVASVTGDLNVSVYGLQKFPVTLSVKGWHGLLQDAVRGAVDRACTAVEGMTKETAKSLKFPLDGGEPVEIARKVKQKKAAPAEPAAAAPAAEVAA